MSMSNVDRAWVDLMLNVAAAIAGVFMAADMPEGWWGWAKFVAGLVFAVIGVVRSAYKENPTSARQIDIQERMAE